MRHACCIVEIASPDFGTAVVPDFECIHKKMNACRYSAASEDLVEAAFDG